MKHILFFFLSIIAFVATFTGVNGIEFLFSKSSSFTDFLDAKNANIDVLLACASAVTVGMMAASKERKEKTGRAYAIFYNLIGAAGALADGHKAGNFIDISEFASFLIGSSLPLTFLKFRNYRSGTKVPVLSGEK